MLIATRMRSHRCIPDQSVRFLCTSDHLHFDIRGSRDRQACAFTYQGFLSSSQTTDVLLCRTSRLSSHRVSLYLLSRYGQFTHLAARHNLQRLTSTLHARVRLQRHLRISTHDGWRC